VELRVRLGVAVGIVAGDAIERPARGRHALAVRERAGLEPDELRVGRRERAVGGVTLGAELAPRRGRGQAGPPDGRVGGAGGEGARVVARGPVATLAADPAVERLGAGLLAGRAEAGRVAMDAVAEPDRRERLAEVVARVRRVGVEPAGHVPGRPPLVVLRDPRL